MLNSDFEKAVQHKMEELRFTPPDAVWDNIEASLPKKNRRRLVFYWLLLGLLAGGIGYYFINNSNGKKDEQSVVQRSITGQDKLAGTKARTAPAKADKEKLNSEKPAPDNANKSIADVSGYTKTMKATTITPTGKTINASSQATVSTQTKNVIGVTHNVQEKEVIAQTSGKKIIAAETINDDKNIVSSDVLNATSKFGSNDAGVDDNTLPATTGDDAANATLSTMGTAHLVLAKEEGQDDKPAVANETANSDHAAEIAIKAGSTITATGNAATPSIAKKKQHSWELGLHAGAGISNVENGLFEKTIAASDPLNNSGGSAGGGAAFKTIADPTPGFAYSAGLYAEKPFAKKWSFYTGLQYQYASNNLPVGSQVDSAIILNFSNTRLESSMYYRGGAGNTYTNHYHLLQLPLLVKFRPLAGWPLYLEAGGSFSYLTGSNGLQYNETRNAYISSDDAFNRWLLSGNLGVGVKLAQKTKLPLQLGYRFGYTATSLTKEAFGKQHLSTSMLYLGIRLNK